MFPPNSHRTPDRRLREPEIMDDPALDAGRHVAALRGLGRLNRLSLLGNSLWPPIRDLARQHADSSRRLRVLDLATGGGDAALTLWHRARQAGIELEVLGLDASPRAVQYASQRAHAAGAPVRFAVGDVLAQPLPAGYDVVTCSLFFHHLSDDDAAALLGRMAAAAGKIVLVSDLLRTRRGQVLAWLAARLFTRSDVVRVDAARSVRAAYLPEEVHRLAARAGLDGAVVARRWPQRFLLAWSRRLVESCKPLE